MCKKTKVWLIINMLLILGTLTLYAIEYSVISISAVAVKWHNGISFDANYIRQINQAFNRGILFELGIFSILQLLAYIGYLFKTKLINYLVFILDVLFAISIIGYDRDFGFLIIFFVPLISNCIYLMIWNDEKKSKKKTKK